MKLNMAKCIYSTELNFASALTCRNVVTIFFFCNCKFKTMVRIVVLVGKSFFFFFVFTERLT